MNSSCNRAALPLGGCPRKGASQDWQVYTIFALSNLRNVPSQNPNTGKPPLLPHLRPSPLPKFGLALCQRCGTAMPSRGGGFSRLAGIYLYCSVKLEERPFPKPKTGKPLLPHLRPSPLPKIGLALCQSCGAAMLNLKLLDPGSFLTHTRTHALR